MVLAAELAAHHVVRARLEEVLVDEIGEDVDGAGEVEDLPGLRGEPARHAHDGVALLEAERDDAIAQLAELEAKIEGAKAAVQRARLDMEFTLIRAPVAGRISSKQVSIGSLVSANETVLTSIVSSDPVYFYFDIDERYFLSYARDARARGVPLQEGGGGLEVSVLLSDETIPPQVGILDFSENRIDEQTGTMRVRAVLENPSEVLTPGLFGRINVIYKQINMQIQGTDNQQRTLLVPSVTENVIVRSSVLGLSLRFS